jgi:hypothetical protein
MAEGPWPHECAYSAGICIICNKAMEVVVVYDPAEQLRNIPHAHTFVGGRCVCGVIDTSPGIVPDPLETSPGIIPAGVSAREQEILDHPILHCIQQAFSAAERVLELEPGNGRRPGLMEVEKWLGDAQAAIAALRLKDRSDWESARLNKP